MELEQRAIWEDIQMQESVNHRGIMRLAWPGDKFYYSWEGGQSMAVGES